MSTPFIDCISEISEISNTQEDNVKGIDITMPIYNSIEYSDIYSKTSVRLRQYYRDKPALSNAGNIIDFPSDNNNNSVSFKFKEEITC